MILRLAAALALGALALSGPAQAGDAEKLRLIDKETAITVSGPDGDIVIERVMTSCAKNKGWLQPMVPVPGVTPAGEIEVLQGLQDPDTLVIDMREIDWYVEATIPTAINIPYTEVADRLDELGCTPTGGEPRWDCSAAKTVIAFCNGPVCPQSPTAIKAMDREGFPMSKVMYYRGGMLDWDALGFTTVAGDL